MNELEVIDTAATDEKIGKALVTANALNIITAEDYRKADAFCKGLFDLRKLIKKDFAESRERAKASKDAAAAAYSALVDQEESHTEPIQQAEKVVKVKILIWSNEQEAIRRKEQDRLRAEALKKAEDEKLRKATVLESQGKPVQAIAELEKPTKVAAYVAPPAPVERDTKISEYWSYSINEPREVRYEFCAPSPGLIQRAMQLFKGQGKTTDEAAALNGGIRIEVKIR